MNTGAEVEIVYRMPGLPYIGAYEAWADHVPECTECRMALATAALQDGDPGNSDALCPVGGPLNDSLRGAIAGQHHNASLN